MATTSLVPSPQFRFLDYLEAASKAAAMLLVGTYSVGYLIVSLHTASFGFADFNPLKPRVLAAGVLFLFLTAVPSLSAIGLFSHRLQLTTQQESSRKLIAALAFFLSCFIWAALSSFLYPISTSTTQASLRFDSLQMVDLVVWLAAFILAFVAVKHADTNFMTRPFKSAALVGLFLVFFFIQSWRVDKQFSFYTTCLWFFFVGIAAIEGKRAVLDATKRKEFDWFKIVILLLSAFSFFPNQIYPNIKSSWGGGSPIPVVIYFSKESRVLPNRQLEADLLDQSENGLYIARRHSKQAIFIPSSAVSAIYFSESGLEASLFDSPPTVK